MNPLISEAIFTVGLLVGMIVLLEAGRRIGARRVAKDAEGVHRGVGAIEGAVFGLLGLLIAFTFSGTGSKFDERRQLIIEETNAIGTAYLRLDLLTAGAQPALKESFRRYVDERLQVYRKLPDTVAAKKQFANATRIKDEIWRQAVAASHAEGAHPSGGHAAVTCVEPALRSERFLE